MNTEEITCILKSDAYTARGGFMGVFACDRLVPPAKFPALMIANTDTHDLPGTHWVAMYFDKMGNGEYFDSYGLPPFNHHLMSYFLQHGRNHKFNVTQIQGPNTMSCGHYCIAFLVRRARGKSMNNIVNSFRGEPGSYDLVVEHLVKTVYPCVNNNNKTANRKCNQICCARIK